MKERQGRISGHSEEHRLTTLPHLLVGDVPTNLKEKVWQLADQLGELEDGLGRLTAARSAVDLAMPHGRGSPLSPVHKPGTPPLYQKLR